MTPSEEYLQALATQQKNIALDTYDPRNVSEVFLKQLYQQSCIASNREYTYPAEETRDETKVDQIILSDDQSSIVVGTLKGKSGGVSPILSQIYSKCGLGVTAAERRIFGTDLFDLGYYPAVVDTVGEKVARVEQETVNGIPISVAKFSYRGADNKQLSGRIGVSNGVCALECDTFNINDFKLAFRLASINVGKDPLYNCKAHVDTIDGHEAILVEDVASGRWLGITSNKATFNFRYIGADLPNVAVSFNNDVTEYTGKTCIGVGFDGLGASNSVTFYIAMGLTAQQVGVSLARAVNTNSVPVFDAAQTYFKQLYSECDIRFKGIQNIDQKIGRALYNIVCLKYHNYFAAGLPNWGFNFIRDTGWVIKALSAVHPRMAKELILFFAGTNLIHTNSFDYEKHIDGGYENSDNLAVLLLAIGEYYRNTKDAETLATIHPQIEQCMQYFNGAFNIAAGHVLATHPHDYWDDYAAEIDVSLVKYESTIDALWKAALISISAYLPEAAQLAAQINLDAFLIEGTDELAYAIKQDGTFYNTVATSPQHIFAGWLLDPKYAKYLISADGIKDLSPARSTISCGIAFSNTKGAVAVTNIWYPHLIIASIIFKDLRWLDNDNIAMCEYCRTILENTDFKSIEYALGANIFSWTAATWLELSTTL